MCVCEMDGRIKAAKFVLPRVCASLCSGDSTCFAQRFESAEDQTTCCLLDPCSFQVAYEKGGL